MSVVARMYVSEITTYAYNPKQRAVKLQVVSRGTENKEWAAATPSGSVTLVINNGDAASQFEPNDEYEWLVTFDRVPKA